MRARLRSRKQITVSPAPDTPIAPTTNALRPYRPLESSKKKRKQDGLVGLGRTRCRSPILHILLPPSVLSVLLALFLPHSMRVASMGSRDDFTLLNPTLSCSMECTKLHKITPPRDDKNLGKKHTSCVCNLETTDSSLHTEASAIPLTVLSVAGRKSQVYNETLTDAGRCNVAIADHDASAQALRMIQFELRHDLCHAPPTKLGAREVVEAQKGCSRQCSQRQEPEATEGCAVRSRARGIVYQESIGRVPRCG